MGDLQAEMAIYRADRALQKYKSEKRKQVLTKRIAFAIMKKFNKRKQEKIAMSKTTPTTQPSTVSTEKKSTRRIIVSIVLPWAILYTLIVLAAGAYFGNKFMDQIHDNAKADAVSSITTLK